MSCKRFRRPIQKKLPNRSVAEPEQAAIELPETQSTFEKTQLSNDKTHFNYGKTQLTAEDQDWELLCFTSKHKTD